MGDPTREAVAAAARDIAARLGLDTLRRDDFFKESSFTRDQVYRLFPDDGWRGVLEAAGLRVLDDDWVTHVARVSRHVTAFAPFPVPTRTSRVPHGCPACPRWGRVSCLFRHTGPKRIYSTAAATV